MAQEIADIRNSDFTFETQQEKVLEIRLNYNKRII